MSDLKVLGLWTYKNCQTTQHIVATRIDEWGEVWMLAALKVSQGNDRVTADLFRLRLQSALMQSEDEVFEWNSMRLFVGALLVVRALLGNN